LKVPLTRYQFVEFLIRIASEKYMRSGYCDNYSEALEMLMKNGIQEALDNVEDPQVWRENRLWKNDVDDLILNKQESIRKLFRSFAGKLLKKN